MSKILKLVNDKKWKKIINMIDNNKIKPLDIIADGNNIFHLATINNNRDIINYALKNDINLLKNGNQYGDTPLHIAAKYGYNDIIKTILKNNNEMILLENNDGETLLHLVYDNGMLLNWIINNIKDVNLDKVDNNNNSILLLNIDKSKSINDKYYKNIKLLLDNGASINTPKKIPPLSYASHMGKEHIVSYFMTHKNNGMDVDVKDNKYLTPLIRAINSSNFKIAKILIDNGADINYVGPEGRYNTMMNLIENGNDNMVSLYLDNGYDTLLYDKNMNTALHKALYEKRLNTDTLFKLMYKSDLNMRNIKGVTPLHILLKYYNWENFSTILQKKPIDIFAYNNKNKRPIDYVRDGNMSNFMDLVAVNYTKKMTSPNIERCCNNKNRCSQSVLNSKKCKDIIKKHIIKENNSIPNLNKPKLKIIKEKYSNKGSFNSDSLHNIVYTIIILQKYKQLGIPYRVYNENLSISEKIRYSINLFRSPYGNMISDIVNGYADLVYEISPYLIMWRSSNINYFHNDMEFYLLKALNNPNIRFIMFKLTLIPSSHGTHANIILFDKKTGIMDRFDPYGYVPLLESDKMDNFLKNKFKDILDWYVKKNKLEFTYLSPKDFMGSTSFQSISDDSKSIVKKLGDPIGYCLAWVFWYVEMRMNNPDMHSKELISSSIENIVENNKSDKSNNIFIDFIRNYSLKLDKLKNEFLIDAGINKDRIYNLVLKQDEDKIIVNHAIKIFNKIVKK